MKMTNLCVTVPLLILFFCLNVGKIQAQTNPDQPNILLIISDDLGVDYTNGYQSSPLLPITPNLDALRAQGITFDNVWAAPQCTPTRAAIMSGKHGIKTGASEVPSQLNPNVHTSVFAELATQTNDAYADALIGKWHIAPFGNLNAPATHGIDYYAGAYRGGVNDYYDWTKVENGTETNETNYTTNEYTDDAIDWIADRNTPWLLWLAHNAPHSPWHTPPDSMYTTAGDSNNLKYVQAIEAMDHSIGRLLDNIDPAVLANTLIIYIGDNGTPNNFVQNYPNGFGKGRLYQGGVHVPLIVAGKGVTRIGEREKALVNATDIYATILETAGADLPGGIYNSLSFKHVFDNSPGDKRLYNYMDYTRTGRAGWTVRNAQYKYISFTNGIEEFYDLINDPFEETNLMESLTDTQQAIMEEMQTEGNIIRVDWSCQDFIQNGAETDIDIDGTYCNEDPPPPPPPVVDCTNPTSQTNIGCCATPAVQSLYSEIVYQQVRTISSNNFPNHDYCYNPNNMPNPVFYLRQVSASPTIAATTTSILSPNNRPRINFGSALNGIFFSPSPATPFIFENQSTGEYNWDWVLEPTNNQGGGQGWVRLDCATAHSNSRGYHYHGNMFEYVEGIQVGISTTTTPPDAPIQVGWASDGFPILYRFGPDADGNLALLQPGFQLKPGERPGDGITAPCGPYNGKYTNDYEHLMDVGDLDECNGIERTITLRTLHGEETFDYFYMITDSFPQISRCMVGTVDATFRNNHNANTCYTSLVSQTVILNDDQSVTVGSSTYTAAGVYQDILTNSQSCDSIIVTTVETETALPLTLNLFEVEKLGENTARLYWQTSNEESMSHFTVQKSFDGMAWIDVGNVDAVGNSNTSQSYEYQDILNQFNVDLSEQAYYRLKTVDVDGTYALSTMRTIEIDQMTTALELTHTEAGSLIVHAIINLQDKLNIRLFDMQGRQVREVHQYIQAGENKIFDNLNQLVGGVYVVHIYGTSGIVFTKRIVL